MPEQQQVQTLKETQNAKETKSQETKVREEK